MVLIMNYRRIDVYIPESHLDAVKDAMFAAGAGAFGGYDRCCFQFSGYGQFRPLDGAEPFIGTVGKTERVPEWKVEMICPEEKLHDVIAAMRRAHPYETPAFQHWQVEIE